MLVVNSLPVGKSLLIRIQTMAKEKIYGDYC